MPIPIPLPWNPHRRFVPTTARRLRRPGLVAREMLSNARRLSTPHDLRQGMSARMTPHPFSREAEVEATLVVRRRSGEPRHPESWPRLEPQSHSDESQRFALSHRRPWRGSPSWPKGQEGLGFPTHHGVADSPSRAARRHVEWTATRRSEALALRRGTLRTWSRATGAPDVRLPIAATPRGSGTDVWPASPAAAPDR